ncbi:hypothetical protein HYV58_00425, partial [Candidatus Peregrinibacteria bacterium]|nr:hypothetical protein [Candidatus Peregrinibacteria bacterium]
MAALLRALESEYVKPDPSLFHDGGFSVSFEEARDDAGKRVEVKHGTITVRTAAEAKRAVEYAKQHGVGVMPIGSKTSAVGAFEAPSLNHANGWVGLQISPHGQLSELSKAQEAGYTVIPVLEGRARILKSDDPNKPHRVQAWGGLTPDELDNALIQELGPGHTVHLDLTTRDQAQISAVVATGGQGPVRVDASFNLHGVVIIDKNAKVRHLIGDEARMQVGLGGEAGAITEVDFEVVKEEPHEFGLVLPIPGTIERAIGEAFPKIMAKLAQFVKKEAGPMRIKGFEIITYEDIKRAYELMEHQDIGGRIGSMLQAMRDLECDTALMMNGRTSLNAEDLFNCLSALYEEESADEGSGEVTAALQGIIKSLKNLIGEGFVQDDPGFIAAFLKGDATGMDMAEFRKTREAVAVAARESKKEGPTKSTDLNLHVVAGTEEEFEAAYRLIWQVYGRYIQDMNRREAKVFVYGHNHPGEGRGGGVDAHIRVTFPLEAGDHQARAAENLAFLGGRQTKLYDELIALHGQHGISVLPGEKGKLQSPEYIRWMEQNNPEMAERIWRYIQQYGGDVFGGRTEKFKLHAHPPRTEDGVLDFFPPDPNVPADAPLLHRVSRAIMLWCQKSHRSPEGQTVFCELLGLFRDWLELDFSERVFIIESAEKALHTALLSVTDYKSGKAVGDFRAKPLPAELSPNITTIVVSNPEDLQAPQIAGCYKILFLADDQKVDAEIRAAADFVIYAGENFGAGGELGVMITTPNAIKRARELERRGNNIGYVHSIVQLDKNPHSTIETPKMQIIAELACLMAQKLGGSSSITREEAAKMVKEQSEFVTMNPGPSQIHPRLIAENAALTEEAVRLSAGSPEERRSKVLDVKTAFKKLLGIPADYQVFFGGSATGAMEQTVESLALEHAIPVNMGAFGDRLQTVVQRFSPAPPRAKVRPLQIRWGKGPNSNLGAIVEEIKANGPNAHLKTACGVFLTGHETSTGVEADISAIAGRLDPGIYRIVDGTSEIGAIPRNFKDIDVYFAS